MKRDIKKEFKEIVRVAAPVEKVWMSGYLEANIDEDLNPAGVTNPLTSSDTSDSIPKEKNTSNEKYLSMVGSLAGEGNSTKEISQNDNGNQASQSNVAVMEPPPVTRVSSIPKTIGIVFGTETGNSKKIAGSLSQKLKSLGIKSKVSSTTQYKVKDLSKEEALVCIVSTHGDGEPPEAARKFYNDLKDSKEQLNHLNFAVLALGDTSYPLFCQTGKDIDAFLQKLGANRIIPTGLCDVDYEEVAEEWMANLLQVLQSGISSGGNGSGNISHVVQTASPVLADSQDSNVIKSSAPKSKKLLAGRIRSNISLTDSRASKEIRHIEIESDDAIPYQPGDSVGLFPKNDSKTVNAILKTLRLDPTDSLIWRDQEFPAKSLFQEKVSIRYLSERFLNSYENLTRKKLTKERLDLVDLLAEYPPHESIDKQSIIQLLEPLPPRYYSIASSPEAHGTNEVHITVADVEIDAARRSYRGLCTGNLFEMEEGTEVEFRIQKNDNFRLPDANADIIMIGPGTGIAPFRSFLYERDALGHTGKNWLFFGNRNFSYDFLYHAEFLELFDSGALSQINTAFSRDSDKKVYVQDKLWEKREELIKWIENGAIIYVCGSKDPMSKDVDEMLVSIFHDKWKNGKIEARKYLDSLAESGRYKKDVY
ncbi:MAG: sulfite reductase flavoprotein subunit alpha [Leptospira sp.]|nr:sulfite reductase flavoprotein subunit alpha [Leptospira sp.]